MPMKLHNLSNAWDLWPSIIIQQADTHCGVEQVHLAGSLLKQIDARDALCALHQGLLHAGRVQDAAPPVPPAVSVPVAPDMTLARLALRQEFPLDTFRRYSIA